MKTTSHTPGPWIFTGNAGQVFTFNSRKIADCGNAGMSKENASNAMLISAAPDMFDALQAIVDAFGDQDSLLIDQCKAALSKAKGESK